MAKTNLLKGVRELDARIDEQLRHFASEEEEEPGKKKWGPGKLAAGVAGSAAASAVLHRPDLVKKGAKKAGGAVLRAGENGLAKGSLAAGSIRGKMAEKASSGLFRGASKVAGLRKKLTGLHAMVDEQLQHFGLDPDDYVSERVSRKKKRRTAVGAAMAGAAVAGGVAAAGKRAEITEAAKTAGFRGMRKTAGAMNAAGNTANRISRKLPGKAADVAAGVGGKLKKGAKGLRKGSMKLFSARLDRVAAGLVRHGI